MKSRAELSLEVPPKLDAARSYLETSDGVHLFYQDYGPREGKTIVFVHSWAMNSDMWQYNALDFEERGFRCIALDRRGHGRSDRPHHGYTMQRLADDIGELFEALDLRDVTLIGHSLGGAECVAYLSRFGARRVSRLVLLAPATPFLTKTVDNPEGLATTLTEGARAQWRADFPRWLDDGAEGYFRPAEFGVSRDNVEWTKGMLRDVPLQIVLRTGNLVLTCDQRDAVRALTLPALVIHGDADESIPVQFGRATAKLLPNGQYREYPGAPHGLYYTHRAQICEDVLAFIGGAKAR